MSKIEPSVQTMTFQNDIIVPPGGVANYYIDLSQSASVINRRFYRQGINWAVAGFKFLGGSTGTVVIQMGKLPNTWVLSNAWEKSFRTWTRMNNEALAESPSVRPRFLDFKIYADDQHHTAGFGGNLLPSGFAPGEWEPSKFVIPDTTLGAVGGVQEREVVGTGTNYPGAGASGLNAISMIEGYAASRGLPNILDPNAPADAGDADGVSPENWMSAVFNEGTQQVDDVLDDMISDNNVAPYPFENGPIVGGGTYADTQYPNGANQGPNLQIHDIEFVTTSTIGATTRMKGGNFPCGLVKITVVNGGTEPFEPTLLVDLIPGTHRGYLCEPMTEM